MAQAHNADTQANIDFDTPLPQPVLVVNAGSSSLKVKLLPQGHALLVERIGQKAKIKASFQRDLSAEGIDNHYSALQRCLELLAEVASLADITAVGHRVVHGGERYHAPTRIDGQVIADIENLSVIAPLHNPANLEGIRAATQLLSAIPHVAVFDTAFHAGLPAQSFLYGLPRFYYLEEGIRRYGFHGPSHDYVTRRAAALLGSRREDLKLISLHLGNGSSAAAVAHGVSVDTTMGFSPIAGLMMGTRSGDIDPGVLLHLLRGGMSVDELDHLLNRKSGLLGLSGLSNDMRDLRQASSKGNQEAAEAIAVFCQRIRNAIGSLAASMGGLDGVIFTGGIGENDILTRVQALEGLEFLGIQLDDARNQAGEHIISRDDSPVKVLRIPTDEERMIAQAALHSLEASLP